MKISEMVPEIYIRESRDFAAVASIFEVIFNYMKTAADNVGLNPNDENIDSNMVQLLVNTLGFESKHEYNTKDLMYVASAFTELIRDKGSITAIEEAIHLLLSSQGIDKLLSCNFSSESEVGGDRYELDIKIPGELKDIVLLEDLFEYILPAGMTYKFTRIEWYSDDSISSNSNCVVNEEGVSKEFKSDSQLGLIRTAQPELTPELTPSDSMQTINTGVVVSEITASSNEKSSEE